MDKKCEELCVNILTLCFQLNHRKICEAHLRYDGETVSVYLKKNSKKEGYVMSVDDDTYYDTLKEIRDRLCEILRKGVM